MRSWIKNLFQKSPSKRSRNLLDSPALERLETRVNPTTVANPGGLVIITGTAGPDNLILSLNNNQLVITETGPSGLNGNAFGVVVPVNTNTLTIDFANNAAAKAFTGIQVNLKASDDTLNIVAGLDCRNLLVNPGNQISLSFNGGGLQTGETDTMNFEGIMASKNNIIDFTNFSKMVNNDPNSGPITIQAFNSSLSIKNSQTTGGNQVSMSGKGAFILEATKTITVDSNLNLGVGVPLTVRGIGPTDQVNISSTAAPALTNSFTGNGALTIRTQGNVNIQGAVTLKNSPLLVQDTDNFTALADVTVSNMSITSNTNKSSTIITFNRNVTTTAGNFSITNLGNTAVSGAQFFINTDAATLPAVNQNLSFTVANNFNALNTGGLYDLFICGNTSTVFNNATITNLGSLTLGTVNTPLTAPPNSSFTTQNGYFDASQAIGPTNLFANITSGLTVSLGGSLLVQAASAAPLGREFTIQAQNGDLKIDGQIQLQDNLGNPSLGSDLVLQAGVNALDRGNIDVQSVIGTNRTLTINDCQNFTAAGSIQILEIVLQATGGDANQGAGQYIFNGNVGLTTNPTKITAANGKYGIQILGSANVFGSLPPAVLSDFNNSGRIILGDNISDTVNFTGGAIFRENTQLAGTGVITGNVRVQGALTPGNYTFVNTSGKQVPNDVGTPVFNNALVFEEINGTLPPDLRTAVYYADLLGNTAGVNQDQIVANSGFVLTNNPILYPLLRTTTVNPGSQFMVVRLTDGSPVAGKFTGLVNQSTNTYAVLNENDKFFAGGAQYQISYQGGDGNDVVLNFLGYGAGTNVFVDVNNVLNVIGDNQASNVTAEIKQGQSIGSVALNNIGSGYNRSPNVAFTGTPTIDAIASTTLQIDDLSGTINGASPGANPGTGYALNDQIQILGGNTLATATVTNVNGTGGILALTITNPLTNNGYDMGNLNTLSIQAVTGVGVGGTVSAFGQFVPISGGSGYVANQVVTLGQGNNTTATAVVTGVGAGGNITGLFVNNPGSGYTDLTSLTVTGSTTGNFALVSAFGSVDNLLLNSGGSGYATTPNVVITSANAFGSGAIGTATLNNVLNIQDPIFGLIGFAYGSKAVNNNIDIQIFNPVIVQANQFNGFNVQMNGGSDTLNLKNVDLVAANTKNSNINNVYFSLNGGPTLTPNQDSDSLNLLGTNQNVETGTSGTSTVLVQGYDFIHSRDPLTGPSSGLLSSANQGNNSLRVLGPVFYDSGNITLGSNNRADTTNSNPFNQQKVPNTAGTITLTNDAYLGDNASLTLGTGAATNLVLQSIKGTPNGLPSNLGFNVSKFNSVQNGTNPPQVINISGGNISVSGTIGTDIGTFLITDSGITNFNGSVDARVIDVLNNDGGINFKSAVGAVSNPDITIRSVTLGSAITFNGNLTANSFTTAAGSSLEFSLRFLGTTTTVTKNTNLINTGGIILGDSNDTLNFIGGLDVGKFSPLEMYATIQSQGALINIASNSKINGIQEIGFTLNGPSTIRTTFGANVASGPIQLGRLFSNSNTLTLDSGIKAGSTITLEEARGDNGNIIILNSAGANISQVGRFSTNTATTSNEIFGTISIVDSINDIVFNGPMLARRILTTDKFYNVIFQGNSDPNVANSRRVFLILDPSPTVFRNRGNVTLGLNGADPETLLDYLVFNGGLDTTLITGVTNLGGSINTNNTDMAMENISINARALLNTYLSTTAYDVTRNLNQAGFFFFGGSFVSFLSPQLQNSAEANILNLFGYNTSGVFETFPTSTGNIILGPVNNVGNLFELNAGGAGQNGDFVTGNITMDSYMGSIGETLAIYRGANVNFLGEVNGNTINIGTLANGFFSNVTELTGLVSIQGNLTLGSSFQVSKDVNNLAILGSINTITADNSLNNFGYIQLGNSATDQFNVSSNFNVRGPGERRIGGIFNITNGKSFDLGTGPTTLVADSIANTTGIGLTTFGAITNNAFDLTINGTAQIQRYANDSVTSPYPDATTPSSYIPINNVLGAGTGGGNVIFNGEVVIQEVKKTELTSINVTNGGTGYTQAPNVVVQGGGGAGATATAFLGITNILNVFGGSGYLQGDVVTLQSIFNPPSSPATANVATIGPGGSITSLNLIFNGNGYNNLFFVQINGGSGTGASIRATGSVSSISILNPGSGFSSAPQVVISSSGTGGTGASATSTIATSTGFPAGNIINIPPEVFLKKQGTGAVYLNTDSSANTAGLVTTIENGAFFYENGKINALTTTSVINNGMLGGSKGTLGTVSILPGGNLAPGNLNSPIGVLNMVGGLTIQGDYNVNIRSQAFSLFDRVNVTGGVTLAQNGVSATLNVNFTPDASIAVGNIFGIISNDGTDPVQGAFTGLPEGLSRDIPLPDGSMATVQITYKGNIGPNLTTFTGGNDVVLRITAIVPAGSSATQAANFPKKLFAVSTDAGGGPVVKVNFDNGEGFSFYAYAPTFTGGVRTAIGDINGDGQPDLVTAAGPGGGPHVVVWSIRPGLSYATVQAGFFAFEPNFTGGITLATGNLDGDVYDDIIVGAGAGGGPRVAAFAGNPTYTINPNQRIADFFAYSQTFNQGVNVASGDRINNNGFDEIITGAAQGGGPHVQVFNIKGQSLETFFAYSSALTCGVFVAAGDIDADGIADIYTGTGKGPIATAGIFFGNGAVSKFEPFGQFFYGGVRMGAALGELIPTGNTAPNQNFLLAVAGPGGGPQVSIFNGNLNIVDAFFAFQQNFTGGVLASTTVNR